MKGFSFFSFFFFVGCNLKGVVALFVVWDLELGLSWYVLYVE